MTFNPVTKIKLRLNSAQRLEIVLYDVLGKYLGRIFEGSLSQGESQIEFDAGDLSSGIYYFSLKLENSLEVQTRKMILLR